jgi:ABC-type Fe3+ transport system permease subunit
MGLLKAIPDDLYEASAMDGAGPFRTFSASPSAADQAAHAADDCQFRL